MARSYVSTVIYRDPGQKYIWPAHQLNFWNVTMLVGAATILGIFAQFIDIQQTLGLPIPWLFPYGVSVGALAVFFILYEIWLSLNHRLVPGVMLIASFVFVVLWITGIIGTAIQLFGPQGNVSANCQTYVNARKAGGVSLNTLAWLQQRSICSSWYATFAFWLIGTIWWVWMMVMAAQVSKDIYTTD
ncbi:hypothetical protein P152DRAFT_489629 [Eremomyces bilateralis CBS 781.70]|uniref:MARVEL domain-containing protein n=1 Tax=Eremomyces bilateralis CBS 781.70 TaxID=1392243 RepID=A0A6G1FZN8_9PEZI|nr:uncharacterized protein P152DRAFT_489629 [Eremomyces bilateralis CBS 781.70]KAF1811264.1 hypothetical protein P152DRAFT_489629 [Eremomyces bilateralis CBS 781.70]